MTKKDFLKFSIENNYLAKINYYYSVLGILLEDSKDDILYVRDNKCYLTETNEEITDFKFGEPLFEHDEVVMVSKDLLDNLDEDIEVTFGILILNYVLINHALNSKIPFQKDEVNLGLIENKYIANMLTDDSDSTDLITIDEYVSFVDSSSFLETLANLIVYSATEKNVEGPKDMDKFRKQVIKELDDKYGPEWKSDLIKISEYEAKLKEHDKEYLKDDPSLGVLASGKVLNVARKKMYGSVGGLYDDLGGSGKITFIENSLTDGWPSDKESLTAMFNESREGSFKRGKETQFGGVMAKTILRLISGLEITLNDCGSKRGKMVFVNENNYKSLKGRYKIVSKESIELTDNDLEKLINTTIELRSPQYCLEQGNSRCSVCTGKIMSAKKEGLPLLGTEMSNVVLTASLKSMHGVQLATTTIDLDEVLN